MSLSQSYDDIIHHDRPASAYPRADIQSRAAQFAPYSALETFDEVIDKTTFLLDLYK